MSRSIKFKNFNGKKYYKGDFPENYNSLAKTFNEIFKDDIKNYQLFEEESNKEIKNQEDFKSLAQEKKGTIKIIVKKIDNENKNTNINININKKIQNDINKNEIIDESNKNIQSIEEDEKKVEEINNKILIAIKKYKKILYEETLEEISQIVDDEITEKIIEKKKKNYQ